jgi:ribosome-associated toxin RatA of RatAB toxin-antitoxin module
MFRVMALSQSARLSLGLLAFVAWGAAACASTGPSPKTVVDNVGAPDKSASPADPPASPAAGDAPKPAESEDVEPVAVPIEDSGLVEAKATITIHAPLDKTRATVLKFEDYPQFMPEYSDAKHIGKAPDGNDKVYMEITTLGGVAKMFANIELLPVRKDGASEIHEAKFLDGNVKQFKAVWTLTKVDDNTTTAALQVFLHPSIPLPDFLVNKANLDGAKKGVIAMKKRVEGAH